MLSLLQLGPSKDIVRFYCLTSLLVFPKHGRSNKQNNFALFQA